LLRQTMTRRQTGAVTARPGVPGRPAARRWPGLGWSRVRGKRAAIPCAAWLESEPNSVPLCSRDSGTPGNQRALRTFCVWASCSCSRQWSEVCGCRLPTRSSGVCSRPRQPWPTALRPGTALCCVRSATLGRRPRASAGREARRRSAAEAARLAAGAVSEGCSPSWPGTALELPRGLRCVRAHGHKKR